ncbi:pentapeptide repeat-containing protein [Helicobacter mustelae]|uniref:Putative membrane protein n=1 Tax=Helicobacter mustelae (strain ATCC 43772 / CCUG 25715 / CIP 103759 / LMG 18044 / NCTC 12198 / R85-136P) TaxID=679897 RepID=D3UFQ9_HELM1|nr:pentapeptide repeat-containing protein [Helicobacter mustelae]CBG39330.1 Putative membrane protein [Helicobacter mustelae 12198]SQH70842.1 membrane protein [Helicobacter mustelae]
MDRKKWFLSEKTSNLARCNVCKVYSYDKKGVMICGEMIEGEGLLELNFDSQDLEIEKFVFEKIYIVELQVDDILKVCIDIDKSLEEFPDKIKTTKFTKKLKSVIEPCEEISKKLLPSLTKLQNLEKQMGLGKELLDMSNRLDNLSANYKKYLQPQKKLPYLFCFEKCILENIDFSDEIAHKLEFKGNTFLGHCKIFNKTFLEKVIFLDNIFEQLFLIDKSSFKKDLSFKACKITKDQSLTFSYSHFEGEVFVLGNQLEQLKIESSSFDKNVYFGLDSSINPEEGFGYSKFNQSFILKHATFVKKAYFERCNFRFCVIDGCKFQDDTFFDYSSFDEITILKTFFDQRTSFYYATFQQPPLFTNCVFKHLTMTGSKLGLNSSEFIEKVRSSAISLCTLHNDNGSETISRPNNTKEIDDFIKDYRDGFCAVKNGFIKNNNTLDASNYHRVELYCKEIELDFQKPKIFSRDWIEKYQLFFYRHTSDHHTDLLRIWNSLMCLVFLFGGLSFGAMVGVAYYFDNHFSIWNLSKLPSLFIFYDSHIRILIHDHPYYLFGINLGSVLIFLLLFLGLTCKWSRWIYIPLGYLFAVGIFAISPKLLFPAIGFFAEKREILDLLSIIGGVYTLLFGLLLYSLIKTARKNSIIPS